MGYTENEEDVTLKFADGTEETASVVVGCDGIHSQVRATMFGASNILSHPHYSGDGCYRATIPMADLVEAIGDEARRSQILLGPDGYFLTYPMAGAKNVNCGGWKRNVSFKQGGEWVLPRQRKELDVAFKDWGETVHQILKFFSEETAFWAAHQFTHQPDIFHGKRVVLVGDGAHAMPPHLGSGAGQGVEDVYVLAEVLGRIKSREETPSSQVVEAAFRAYEETRKPRFLQVQQYSTEAAGHWYNFYLQGLEGVELQNYMQTMREIVGWIWDIDLAAEASKACERLNDLIAKHSA